VAALTTADLQFLRDCAVLALPDTCDIQTSQHHQDGSGGYTEAWATSYQDVPCRIAPSGSSGEASAVTERLIANRRSGVSDWMLTLPFDQPITEAMRFIHLGRTYEVIFVHRPQSFDTVRRCLVRRY
jgi:head-tail adaptor